MVAGGVYSPNLVEGLFSEVRSYRRWKRGCPRAPRRRAPFCHNARVLSEGDLPPGYRLREEADLLVLLRPDGSEVAAFIAGASDLLEVIVAAWEDCD